MLAKSKVIKAIRQLPNSFTLDELIDAITIVQKIEAGIEQSKKGQVKSTTFVKKSLKKWLK